MISNIKAFGGLGPEHAGIDHATTVVDHCAEGDADQLNDLMVLFEAVVMVGDEFADLVKQFGSLLLVLACGAKTGDLSGCFNQCKGLIDHANTRSGAAKVNAKCNPGTHALTGAVLVLAPGACVKTWLSVTAVCARLLQALVNIARSILSALSTKPPTPIA